MFRIAPITLMFACAAGNSPDTTPTADDSAPTENSPPRIDELGFDPAVPSSGRSVRCVVNAIDDDGDRLDFTYLWTVDGVARTDVQGDTLPANAFDAYQDLTCSVTLTDGRDSVDQSVSAVTEEACGALGFQASWYSVTTPDTPELSLGAGAAEFTVETWAYLQPVESGSRALFWKQQDDAPATSTLVDWGLIVSADGTVHWATGRTDDGCGYLTAGPGTVPNDRWFHIAATYTSDGLNGQKRLYIDGQSVVDCQGELKNAAVGGHLVVGGATSGVAEVANHGLYNGSMDEARISSVDRYQATDFIPEIYHSVDPDTVALWHFNRDDTDALLDASGYGHDLWFSEYAEAEVRPLWFDFGVSCDENVPVYDGYATTSGS